jgi:hypothetical protein
MGKINNKLPVDWEAVHAFWIQSGRDYASTSKAFGIKRNTLIQAGKRKGWKSPASLVRTLEETKRELAVMQEEKKILSPVTASVSFMEDQKKSFHSSMAIGLTNAASCLTELDNLSALEASRKMVDLANAGKTIFGIGSDTDKPTLSLNVLQIGLDALSLVQPTR